MIVTFPGHSMSSCDFGGLVPGACLLLSPPLLNNSRMGYGPFLSSVTVFECCFIMYLR